jgi:hypothetical protein
MQGGSHLFLFSGCINSPLAATVANHCLIPPVLPTERVAHGGAQETYCGAGFSTGLCRLRVVCVRSKRSDLAACPLCPESRQIAVSLGMSALCHNRLMRCSKQASIRSPRRRLRAATVRFQGQRVRGAARLWKLRRRGLVTARLERPKARSPALPGILT